MFYAACDSHFFGNCLFRFNYSIVNSVIALDLNQGEDVVVLSF